VALKVTDHKNFTVNIITLKIIQRFFWRFQSLMTGEIKALTLEFDEPLTTFLTAESIMHFTRLETVMKFKSNIRPLTLTFAP